MAKRGNPNWQGKSGNPRGRPVGTTNQVGDIIRADKKNLPRLLANLRRLQKSDDEAIALKATEAEMRYAWSYAPQAIEHSGGVSLDGMFELIERARKDRGLT